MMEKVSVWAQLVSQMVHVTKVRGQSYTIVLFKTFHLANISTVLCIGRQNEGILLYQKGAGHCIIAQKERSFA